MPLSDAAVRTLKPREKAYKTYDRDGTFSAGKSQWLEIVAVALQLRGQGKADGAG